MHKSKLAGFIIDCKTNDIYKSAEFWANVLGLEMQILPVEEGEKYVKLKYPENRLHIEVQSVEHESRVHLDIETDNIDAEVSRIEGHGAKIVEYKERWCVMEAPTGQRFCVVRSTTSDFEKAANIWE